MNRDQRHDHLDDDPIVDAMLAEATGRERPPDLTARIAAELEIGTTDDPDVEHALEQPEVTRSRALPWRTLIAAAAAGVLIGVTVAELRSAPMRIPVTIEVVRGSAVLRTTTLPQVVEPTATLHETYLALGDRIHSADGAALRLRPFGILELDPESTVEVESMAWTKRDGVLVVGSLAFGSVVGAFAWSQVGDSRVEANGPIGDASTENTVASGEAATAQLAELRDEVERLKSENATLLAVQSRERVEDPDEPTAETVAAEFTFEPLDAGGMGDALANIDFALIGKTSKDLMPLITELAKALQNGEEMPLELAGKIQTLNGGLVAEAGKMVAAGVEGSGVNGAYTHPAVAGNRILATLEAAGLGLDEEQRKRLSGLMNNFGQVDRNLRIDDANRELSLESLVEEADYKQKFFDEVRGMLGADQAAVLGDSAIGDRLSLSLHGPGLVLAQYARPTPVANRGELVDQWSSRLERHLGLEGDAGARMRQTVDAWTREFPSNFFDDKGDDLETQGMMRTARVQDAARRQLELMRRVLAQFGSGMTAEQRESLTSRMRINVPLPR